MISLSLVLALVGWTTVCAEDGFYVISGQKRNHAPVPKTGQTTPSAAGDDGTWQKGVASPTPRFTDNGNGTVTDKLTGLIWMRNANAFGAQTWADALSAANGLADSSGDLSDGSKAGDWRLPNVRELQSLVDYCRWNPALPAGHPFTNVVSSYYWSSTSYASDPSTTVWVVYFFDGYVYSNDQSSNCHVWCVRGGP